MEQNKSSKSVARDLYNKVKNGEMSLEQAAKVLAEYPIIAKMLADMLKMRNSIKIFQMQSTRALIN